MRAAPPPVQVSLRRGRCTNRPDEMTETMWCEQCKNACGELFVVVTGCLPEEHVTVQYLCGPCAIILRRDYKQGHCYCKECHGESREFQGLVPIHEMLVEPWPR